MNDTKYIAEPGVHQLARLSDQGTVVFYLSLSLLSGSSYVFFHPWFSHKSTGDPNSGPHVCLAGISQDKLFPQVQLWNLFGLTILLSDHVAEKTRIWWGRAWSRSHVNKIKPWWSYHIHSHGIRVIWDIVTKCAKIFALSLCFIIRSLGS